MKHSTSLASLLLGIALLAVPSLSEAQSSTSTEATGITSCMGSSMRCQVLRQESLTVSGTVYFSGGGYSGSPVHVGYRCGDTWTHTQYIEVYVNDPTFNWPTYCVRADGGSLTLSAGNRYDFRGPSIGATTGWTIPFSVHAQTLQAPTFLEGGSDSYNYLSWQDNSWGESGTAIERRDSGTVVSPRVNMFEVGFVSNVTYTRDIAHKMLEPSAEIFCRMHGLFTFESFELERVSSFFPDYIAWWENGMWNPGSASRYWRMKNLVCKGFWSQVGTVEANVTGYTDTTPVVGRTYDYRVRAYRGSTYSGYSNTVTLDTVVGVGME